MATTPIKAIERYNAYLKKNQLMGASTTEEQFDLQVKRNTSMMKKKHTNFNNEITGSYHNDSFFDGFDWIVALGVVAMIVVTGVIYWVAF